jgi:hypothetical protein
MNTDHIEQEKLDLQEQLLDVQKQLLDVVSGVEDDYMTISALIEEHKGYDTEFNSHKSPADQAAYAILNFEKFNKSTIEKLQSLSEPSSDFTKIDKSNLFNLKSTTPFVVAVNELNKMAPPIEAKTKENSYSQLLRNIWDGNIFRKKLLKSDIYIDNISNKKRIDIIGIVNKDQGGGVSK